MAYGIIICVNQKHMANKLTVHVLAAVAEHEREAISARTKAALAAANRMPHRCCPLLTQSVATV